MKTPIDNQKASRFERLRGSEADTFTLRRDRGSRTVGNRGREIDISRQGGRQKYDKRVRETNLPIEKMRQAPGRKMRKETETQTFETRSRETGETNFVKTRGEDTINFNKYHGKQTEKIVSIYFRRIIAISESRTSRRQSSILRDVERIK